MVNITDLRVTKNGNTICSVPHLAVQPGERLAIVGRNGSGKSTLLRVLGGLERDYKGRCVIAASWRERTYVHQSPFLFRGSVLFNVTYGLRARGQSRSSSETAAMHWLEMLGIRQIAGSPGKYLSGGETRRVALARAMACNPRLLLLDEPLAEIDDEGVARLQNVLAALPQTTIVIATPTKLPDGLTMSSYQLRTA